MQEVLVDCVETASVDHTRILAELQNLHTKSPNDVSSCPLLETAGSGDATSITADGMQRYDPSPWANATLPQVQTAHACLEDPHIAPALKIQMSIARDAQAAFNSVPVGCSISQPYTATEPAELFSQHIALHDALDWVHPESTGDKEWVPNAHIVSSCDWLDSAPQGQIDAAISEQLVASTSSNLFTDDLQSTARVPMDMATGKTHCLTDESNPTDMQDAHQSTESQLPSEKHCR